MVTPGDKDEASRFDREAAWHASYEAYANNRDLRILTELLPPPPQRILDVPCGFGRLSVALADRGYETAGIDLSAACATGTKTRGRPAVRANMVALPIAPSSFDVVVCMGNSIGVEGDDGDDRFFADTRRALKPGGVFILQCGHRDSYVRADVQRWWGDDAGGSVQFKLESFDVVTGWRTTETRRRFSDGSEERDQTRLRLYAATELDQKLRAAGLVPDRWHDGDTLGPLTTASSALLVVCTPAEP